MSRRALQRLVRAAEKRAVLSLGRQFLCVQAYETQVHCLRLPPGPGPPKTKGTPGTQPRQVRHLTARDFTGPGASTSTSAHQPDWEGGALMRLFREAPSASSPAGEVSDHFLSVQDPKAN